MAKKLPLKEASSCDKKEEEETTIGQAYYSR